MNNATGARPAAAPSGSAAMPGAAAAERWLRHAADAGPAPGMPAAWDNLLTATGRELRALRGGPAGLFPHFTVDGRWHLLDVDTVSRTVNDRYEHGNWTAGFAVGLLWLDALRYEGAPGEGPPPAVEEARRRLAPLAARARDHTTHDLGFLFFPSFALGYQLGRLSAAEAEPAVRAARQLFTRYNPQTQLIQAFGPVGEPALAGTSTIDTMMNLPLLFWVGRHGGDPVLADAARRHARTSARLYLRPDGSTYHLLTLDPVSGALADRGTFQGAGGESCWSRGQGWAVCGFASAFGLTGERELLEAAERAAAYFFDHLPASAVAPWDFSAGAAEPDDASASAALALGCLLLAESHPDRAAADIYRTAASAVLGRLADSCLNTAQDRDGVLRHSCYSRPDNLGTDSATAFGDFYFALAIAIAARKVPVSVLLPGRGTTAAVAAGDGGPPG